MIILLYKMNGLDLDYLNNKRPLNTIENLAVMDSIEYKNLSKKINLRKGNVKKMRGKKLEKAQNELHHLLLQRERILVN